MNHTRAFTLIELIVSIGIISLISGVVFFNFPQFNQSVLLNRAARELTLGLREAQARAVAVAPGPDGKPPKNYGLFIDTAYTAEGDGQYVLFIDMDDNLIYNPPASGCSGECVKKITFTKGVRITGFTPSAAFTSGGMSILYYRPGPRTILVEKDGDCIAGEAGSGNGQHSKCSPALSPYGVAVDSYGPFEIKISRPVGPSPLESRTIEIWRTGQVTIK